MFFPGTKASYSGGVNRKLGIYLKGRALRRDLEQYFAHDVILMQTSFSLFLCECCLVFATESYQKNVRTHAHIAASPLPNPTP